jgi:hypothetical protein
VPEGRGPGWPAPDEQRQRPAASTLVDHPGTVYLREADLLPHPDGWLTGLFHPATLDVTPP